MADPYAIDRPGSAFSGAVDVRSKGTIRDKDIQDNVLNVASVIAKELSRQTGKEVTAQITSGGQPTRGIAGITRTGSARHNNGYALDFVLAVDGKKVRPNDNPQLYAQAAKVAAQRGMQGIGVYSHSMHIGTPIGTPQSSIGKAAPEVFWNGVKGRGSATKATADVVYQGYLEGLRNRGILGMPTPRPTDAVPARAVPSPAPRQTSQMSAAPTSDFRAPPPVFAPNKVNTFNFTPANIDPSRFAPGPSVAEIANQYSQYQRGAGVVPQARGSATGSVAESPRGVASGSISVPGRATVNIDPGRFSNFTNVPSAPAQNAYQAPSVIGQGAMSNAGTDNRGSIGPGNQAMVNLERSLMRPDTYPVDAARFAPGPSAAELANQYSQYQRGTIPGAPVQNLVDIPNSAAAPGRLSLAEQYASYGAGKLAPQIASTATQAAPQAPSVPGPVGPSGPVNPNDPFSINRAAQERFDAAKPGAFQGIPPQDIYDQNAPGRSGFRGFGAGGFLGNLLTGNLVSSAGIEGGFRLPGMLGLLQSVVQGIGGGRQGIPDGANLGGLSPSAYSAGWASNNPEINYGGYGSGYDPTPR